MGAPRSGSGHLNWFVGGHAPWTGACRRSCADKALEADVEVVEGVGPVERFGGGVVYRSRGGLGRALRFSHRRPVGAETDSTRPLAAASCDQRRAPVQRVANPPDARPLSFEPAEHRQRRTGRARLASPAAAKKALQS